MKSPLSAAIGAALILLTPLAVRAADPVVSNISAVQRAGTQLVDITYDVSADIPTVAVTLTISSDGGTTFNVPATTVSGAIGAAVAPGTGKVITWNAGADWSKQYSSTMRFKVAADGPSSGFSLIPAGSFQMGDALDGLSDAPIRTVTVSAFYMGQNLVTWADWGTVRTWGLTHGYTDLSAGAGNAATHPVQTITWYDMVKWCNARSEMDGLTPCYTLGGAVYRTTNSDAVVCNWAANGYRLPSEAEWEKAARGGLSGKRFPWGDRISQSLDNYYGSPTSYTYDDGPAGYNSIGSIGGTDPATSPVGSFPANGYGLHDMAGNVLELCWDWYGTYAAGAQTDPRGVASGSGRVCRGGSWNNHADFCRVAHRYGRPPADSGTGFGFRVTISSGVTTAGSGFTITSNALVDTRSTVATLSGLVLNSGTLSPAFAAATTSYTASVANFPASVTVTPTVTDATASVQVNGVTVASGAASASIPLAFGTNTLTVRVTAQDGTTTKTYTITVYKYASSNTITPIVINPIDFGLSASSFSDRLAISGDVIAVNQRINSGLIHVFQINSNSSVTNLNTITAPDAVYDGPNFGISLGVVGNVVYAGCYTTCRAGAHDGTAYLFNSATNASPNLVQKWTEFPNQAAGYFGMEGRMIRDTLVVSQGSNPETGSRAGAFFYRVATNGARTSMFSFIAPDTNRYVGGIALSTSKCAVIWRSQGNSDNCQIKTFDIQRDASNNFIGVAENAVITTGVFDAGSSSIACDSDFVAMGEALGDKVRVWRITAGTATLIGTLASPDQDSGGNFGGAVCLKDGVLIVGSPTVPGVSNAKGCAYIYRIPASGPPVLIRKVQPSAPAIGSGEYFGSPIAWDGDRMIFGSSGEGVRTGSGPVYIYPASALIENELATLSSLVLSSGAFSPGFAAATKTYTTSVSNATSTITVTPTVMNPTATVTVNGVPVVSGSASAPIPLVVGNNPITVVVTAQDGTTTSTYTVTVTRISTVSTLAGLALSAGTLSPAFATGGLTYTASVPNATTSITVTPTVTDATATIKVNGSTSASGAASTSIPLVVGPNVITVAATAQDGTTKSTYTVTVNRISTVSTLSSLVLSSGTLSPAFAAATKTYTTSVTNATTGVTVTPVVTDSTATVTVNDVPVVSDSASASIPLVVGPNPITVVVTAQDGTTQSTYTITVTRISTVSTLSGLVFSTGTLSPVFATGTTSYSTSVPNVTSSITVTPTVTDATATTKVNGTAVASGSASASIPLVVGNNPITVLVTAQDGTTKSTYTISVTRISTISTLSSLVLSSGTLSPAFATATKIYTASVANAITSVTVSPTVTDATATITVNGTSVASGTSSDLIPLMVGPNTITVLVTAQDGTTQSTYTITVTRFATDSSLSGLALSAGTLSPAFATGTLAYTASVSNATTGLTVTPTVTHPAATVRVNGVSVATGTASASIPLVVGTNVITVLATAQDPSFTTSYTITVTRPPLLATFTSATTVPCSLANITTPANVVDLSLAYAPSSGTHLMVVRNAGLGFISGRFANLAQGQLVTLSYNNDTYRFVVNYFGGTGNDLVLQWADNKAHSWGSNSHGQLGDHDGTNSSVPVAVSASGVLADKILVATAAGSSHSVALCCDGTIAAWGNNTYGQLGDGTNNNSDVPVAVVMSGALNGKTVVAIAAGFNHSLALCSDGTVAAWGFNSSGQLGNSNNTSSNVPVAVTKTGALLNKTVVAVAAGYNHNLARCADGAVVAWGNNGYGQLGNNTTTNCNVPVAITTSGELNGRTVVSLMGGSDHSLALCSDGSLVAWGRNNNGQLGNGGPANSSIPVAVDSSNVLSGRTVTAIATGGWHNLALCSDGTLAAFGRNDNGQLGNNSTNDSNVPVAVTAATGPLFNKTITAIGGGNGHSLALCSDGTLAAWGANATGQLGNNSTTASSVPVAVTRSTLGSGETFADLASGSSASHVMALAAFHISSNPTLANLSISGGSLSPAFNADTTDYAVDVPNAIAAATVTPTASQANAVVRVDGVDVASGTASAPIPLVVGTNTITVAVTAQDGITTQTYSFTVTRPPSAVSTLASLVPGSGTLSPAFASATIAYAVSVANAITSLTITPALTDTTAMMQVNGVAVASGAASAPIPLVVGPNPITVLVTAQDETTTSTYTVTVTRAPSAVATLASLALSAGTLSPAFATEALAYTAIVTHATTSITVTPTVTDATATIKVNGVGETSGAASAPIPLVVGSNTITVLVTAQDGTTQSTYTVTVLRVSNDSTLAGLTLSTGTLSPVFAPGTTTYASSTAYTTTSVTVTPTTNHAAATLTISGTPLASGATSLPIPLTAGPNTIEVKVTAEDGITTQTYTVTVTRPPLYTVITSATSVGLSSSGYTATGNTLSLSLGYAPTTGTNLTVINNTGLDFITGRFSNLAQGQAVALTYNGVTYQFVANYHGGTGNDLVLHWANTRTYAWGYNNQGQLGNSTTTTSKVPIAVTGTGVLAGKTVIAVSCGGSHSLALCADGTVAAWGYNNSGQLGNTTTTTSNVPVAVSSSGVLAGKTVVAIAAGNGHSLALCSDGSVAAWGVNGSGELGNNDTANSSVPVAVQTSGALSGKSVTAIAAGSSHSLALCSDGTVAAWGLNGQGQLGNTTTANSSVPVAVSTAGILSGKPVAAISAGSDHNLAQCVDGTVVAWGYNNRGQLGDNSLTNRTAPVAVSTAGGLTGKMVTAVSAGGAHSLALCLDGSVAAWGYNNSGQLGNGNKNNSSIPVAVSTSGTLSGKSVVGVAAGFSHSLARCSDGTVAAWGDASNGQLGNNTTTNSNLPVAVSITPLGTGSRFMAVAAGSKAMHSVALVPISGNSRLAGLAVAAGSLSPVFSSPVVSYLSNAPHTTASTTVTPATSDPSSSVKVNGTAVASGSASGAISLGSSAVNTITVVVTAQDGVTSTTYTVTIDNTPFGIWQKNTFTDPADLADPEVCGDLATPARDGITNLMKYAMALPPMTCATADMPAVAQQAGYLTLTYRKSKTATDVTYTVQAAGDLTEGTWAPATTVLSQTDQGDHWLVTVRDTVPYAGQARRFMRLQVGK